ncbi:MAG: hypothetical protein ABF254_07725 [Octadecabacter sp.]
MAKNAERQTELDRRLPDFLALPKGRKLLSTFPLLGPLDFQAVPDIEISQLLEISMVGISAEWQRPALEGWKRSIELQCGSLGIPCGRDDNVYEVTLPYDLPTNDDFLEVLAE